MIIRLLVRASHPDGGAAGGTSTDGRVQFDHRYLGFLYPAVKRQHLIQEPPRQVLQQLAWRAFDFGAYKLVEGRVADSVGEVIGLRGSRQVETHDEVNPEPLAQPGFFRVGTVVTVENQPVQRNLV